MANFRVRRGYSPEVKRKFVPRIYLSDRAGSIYASGLSRVASGLNALASGVKTFEENQRLEREREDAFTTQMTLLEAENNAITGLQEARSNAPLGAPDFVENNADAIAKSHNELLQSFQERGLSERAQRSLALGLGQIQQSVVRKSLAYQERSKAELAANQMEETGDKLGNLVLDDPDQIESVLERGMAIVDTYDNFPDAIARERFREELREHLYLVAAETVAKTDPQRIVNAFTEYEVNDVIPAMKRAIAGVESAGNADPYRVLGPQTDQGRAIGKYQVMPGNVAKWTREALGSSMTPEEFRNSPEAQEAVFEHRMGQYLEEHGTIRDAASMWFSGQPYSVAKNRDDGYITVDTYVKKVYANLGGKEFQTGNGDGDPVLAGLDARQRLAALRQAEAQINRNQADARAGLSVDIKNAYTAFENGADYTGEAITRDRVYSAYDREQAAQVWAEYQRMEQVGALVGTMHGQSQSTVDARVQALRPKDTSSPTYGVEFDAYEKAVAARNTLINDRNSDSAAYVLRHNPQLNAEWRGALEEGQNVLPASLYEGMWEAYKQLEIPPMARKAFPDAAQEHIGNYLESAAPEERLDYVRNMKANMPEEMFYQALSELDENGFPHEAQLAGLLAQSTEREHVRGAVNALIGLEQLRENKTLEAAKTDFNDTFVAKLQNAHLGLGGRVTQTMYDLALGLYVARGNDPKIVDATAFENALNTVVGGFSNDSNTGIVDLSRGSANYSTILPTGVTSEQFLDWMDVAEDEDYNSLGNGPMMDANGFIIPAEDVAEDGVFVRTGPFNYRIAMGSDGNWVRNGAGEPYVIELRPEEIMDAQTVINTRDEPARPEYEMETPAQQLNRLRRNRVFGDTEFPVRDERPEPPEPVEEPTTPPVPLFDPEEPEDIINRLKQFLLERED